MYVIMENLYAFLDSAAVRTARANGRGLYVGRVFNSTAAHGGIQFNAGGPGYILDRNALNTLVYNLQRPHCNPLNIFNSYEDVNIAACLLHASDNSILPYQGTRDSLDEPLFNPFPPGTHYTYRPQHLLQLQDDKNAHLSSPPIPPPTLQQDWYYHYEPNLRLGLESVSSKSVSFHYLSPQLMVEIHDYLYHCDAGVKSKYFNERGEGYYESTLSLQLAHS